MSVILAGYLALGTGLITGSLSNATLSELAGAGYGRQSVSFAVLSNPTLAANPASVSFGPATATWPTATYAGLFDNAQDGNLLAYWSRSPSLTVTAQGTLSFAAGSLLLAFTSTVLAATTLSAGSTLCLTSDPLLAQAASVTAGVALQNSGGQFTAAAGGQGTTTSSVAGIVRLGIAAGPGMAVSSSSSALTGITAQVSLSRSGVTPATLTNPTLVVDALGRITAGTSGPLTLLGSGPVIVTGAPVFNIGLAASGVVPGHYSAPNVTVDSFGRVISAYTPPLAVAVQTLALLTGPGLTLDVNVITTAAHTATINLVTTGVVAGTYATPIVVVDDTGRVTEASLSSSYGYARFDSTGKVAAQYLPSDYSGPGTTLTTITGFARTGFRMTAYAASPGPNITGAAIARFSLAAHAADTAPTITGTAVPRFSMTAHAADTAPSITGAAVARFSMTAHAAGITTTTIAGTAVGRFSMTARATGTASVTSSTFYVANGAIYTPSGSPFVGKGINVADWAAVGASGNPGDGTDNGTYIFTLFPGINIVRLNWAYNSSVTQSQMATFISNVTAQNCVVILDDHWSDSNSGNNVLTGTKLATEQAWFSSLATAYKNNPYVWFGTSNEPASSDNLSNVAAQQLATYNTVRNAGNNSIVVMEIPPDQSNSALLPSSTYSSMTNIVFDLHYYGWLTNYSSSYTTIQSDLQSKMAAYAFSTGSGIAPVMIGEYGNSTDGESPDANGAGNWVIKACQAAGVTTTAWAWKEGASDLAQTTGSLTVNYGQELAAYIAGRSTTSYINAGITP